jgi:L-amino acid N-acyltransferase YncA
MLQRSKLRAVIGTLKDAVELRDAEFNASTAEVDQIEERHEEAQEGGGCVATVMVIHVKAPR